MTQKGTEMTSCCCAAPAPEKKNCIVCGKPLVYFQEEKMLECRICHQVKPANAACEDGHFVCDDCHAGGKGAVFELLKTTQEKDPIALFLQVCKLEEVHLHGPEHHSIVPCVLLTAYKNCGGEIDFEAGLEEAWKRGQKMAGGSCGYLGVCGAAAGAGIFASILFGVTPLSKKRQWAVPQRLTADCLKAIAKHGGPRCCKRTSRIAIEQAAYFAGKKSGVWMPVQKTSCLYWPWNTECIRQGCPYYPVKKKAE